MMEKVLRESQVGLLLHGRVSIGMFIDIVLASVQSSSFAWPEIFWGQISLSTVMVELCP